MRLPLGKPPSWPYASGSDQDSVGRFLGSVQFGIFHGRLSCWEATGNARREFSDKLGLEVAQYLDCNSELSESGSYFHMSLYMVGKSTLRAKPTVMFVSGDAKVRKDAFKIIKQSGILGAYPGFALAHIPLETEYKNFRQLAGEADSTPPSTGTTPSIVLTTKDGTFGGRRLFFDGLGGGVGNEKRYMATAGGVISFQNRPMFLTVYHAAKTPETLICPGKCDPADGSENSDECGIAGFDELDVASQETDDDLVVTTSRGSATPESSYSNSDHGSVFSVADTVVPDSSTSAIHVRPGGPAQAPKDLTHAKTAIPAGEVVLSSSDLDSLLIGVNPELLTGKTEQNHNKQCIPLEKYSAFVEVEARDAAIKTTTPDGGTIEGMLSGTLTFVRLPFSKKFQQVFTARFYKPLVAGDCGSWVRDAATGKLFGHIIAGSPTTGLATIMPAHRVFAHFLSELEGNYNSSIQACGESSQLRGSNNQPNTCLPPPRRQSGKTSSTGGLGGWRSFFKRSPRDNQADGRQVERPVAQDGVVPQSDTSVVSNEHPPLEDTPQSSSHPAHHDPIGSKNNKAAHIDRPIPPSPTQPTINLAPMTKDYSQEPSKSYNMNYPEPSQGGFSSAPMEMGLSPDSYRAYPRPSYQYPILMEYEPNNAIYTEAPYNSGMYHKSSPGSPDDSDSMMRIPSSSFSVATASSSDMGTPTSNNGHLAPIPEWAAAAPFGLGVTPGIVDQNDYHFPGEYSFVPNSTQGFDFANGKHFVDPSLIHPEVRTLGYPAFGSTSFLSPSPLSSSTSPFMSNNELRRPSFVCFPSNYSADEPDSGYNSEQKQRCPHPDCGKTFKDLKAHMLTHQTARPEKCPIKTCEYHVKGFARKYDKIRHTLTHYKGTMVCGFCPGSGTAAEKAFNRADVFKRHLTAVHGVEQTPPNSRKKAGINMGDGSNSKKPVGYAPDATGKCSICLQTFATAQDSYEHLDDCVLRIVQQEHGDPPDDKDIDPDAHSTLEKHRLPAPLTTARSVGGEDEDMGEDMEDDDLTTSRDTKSSIPPTSQSKGNPPNGVQKSRGLTHSRGGVPLPTKSRGRKNRRDYPSSWGFDKGQMTMKKRVMAVFDGQQRLGKDDMMLETDLEVRVKLAGGEPSIDGEPYIDGEEMVGVLTGEKVLDGSTEEQGESMV